MKDWKGTRVLARSPGQDGYYSACVKAVIRNKDIGLIFDNDQTNNVIYYNEAADPKCLDIIADQAPTPDQVKIGNFVCARKSAEHSAFEYAEVIGVSVRPAVQFQVKFISPNNRQTIAIGGGQRVNSNWEDEEYVWVSRANIRLLRPPWYELTFKADQLCTL